MNSVEYIVTAGMALATQMDARTKELESENKRLLAELRTLQEAQIREVTRTSTDDEIDILAEAVDRLRRSKGLLK